MLRPFVSFTLALAIVLLAVDSPRADEPKKIDRSTAAKKRLLKEFGGSEESEEAVMLGLAWLSQRQQSDGHWEFDNEPRNKLSLKTGTGMGFGGNFKSETAGATGMTVLAFLGAGQSHKEGRYKQSVQAGLNWLVKNLTPEDDTNAGKFRGSAQAAGQIYSQGIATLALCEAYAMTQDAALKEPAQRAINYIQRIQAVNGSWGYIAGSLGDVSIVGWQVQALHAAKLAGLSVDEKVIKKAVEFLDLVAAGPNKASYAYREVKGKGAGGSHPTTSLTAIGLLCRYYIDGWRAENEGFAEGTKGLLARAKTPADQQPIDEIYYYYYAAQVVRFHGGEEWKTWNEGPKDADGKRKGGVGDWLMTQQVRTPMQRGSWDSEGAHIGHYGGRLGTTCMCLLTLEVYYRYDREDGQNTPPKP